jgi:exodeoxyribonuclease VII large subunit
MRKRARVQLIGEVTGVGRSKVQAYFELRDGEGAVPCAIWLNDLEKAGLEGANLRDGVEVVIAGGPDYYPGGGQASPSFCFRATQLRLAGEGDLLARL